MQEHSHPEHDHSADDSHDHDHGHGHHHDHEHHGLGHHHDTSDLSDARLIGTFLLNAALTVVEIVIGALSGSVALMADGVHNLGDAVSLLIAYFARRIARRRPDEDFTFGYERAETVGAVINLTSLIVMAFFLVAESIERLLAPEPIIAEWVIVAASVALVVDLATVGLLWAMAKGSLNLRAAFIHNLSDAAASIVVIIGAVFVKYYGITWLDPLLGLLIAAYILATSFSMLRRAASLLMNSTPPGLDIPTMVAAVTHIEGVVSVHHVHVWELDEKSRAMEAHVVIEDGLDLAEAQSVRGALVAMLEAEFGIGHSTIEIEPGGFDCRDRGC